MIAHQRPTSRTPQDAKPGQNDPLPWWLAILLVGAIVAGVLAARRHPGVPLAAQWLGIAATALMWRTPFITKRHGGRWYGKGTTPVTIAAISTQGFALAANWRSSGNWWVALPVLVVWTSTVIGRSGHHKNHRRRLQFRTAQQEVIEGAEPSAVARKIAAGMPLFAEAVRKASPTIIVSPPTVQADGTVRIEMYSDIPLKVDGLRWEAGKAFGYGQDDVEALSLADTRTGMYVVTLGHRETGPARPWDVAAPEIPPVHEWPPLSFPLGWTVNGIYWASLAIHWMVAGITGSGKSNTLNGFVANAVRLKFGLVLIDPKQTELYPWRHHATFYGDDAKSIMETLEGVEKLRQERMARRREAGLKKWDPEHPDLAGPYVLVAIDEIAEAIKIAPKAAAMIETLARLARAEGIVLLIADQHPTEKSFPTIIKRNMPNVVCHRVKDGGAVRVALSESATGEGWNADDPTLPAGGAAVWADTVGKDWVQVFEDDGDVPPSRVTVAQPQGPWAGETDRDTPVTPQAVTGPVTPPTLADDDGLDGTVQDALHHRPQAIRAIAQAVDCHPEQARRALLRLEKRGCARRKDGGWVNPILADLSFDTED